MRIGIGGIYIEDGILNALKGEPQIAGKHSMSVPIAVGFFVLLRYAARQYAARHLQTIDSTHILHRRGNPDGTEAAQFIQTSSAARADSV